MTTICMHPTHSVANDSSLSRLGAWVSHWIHARHSQWRETEALSNMDRHQLRDVGAPCWLQQRAQSRRAQDCYEYVKAMSRLKY